MPAAIAKTDKWRATIEVKGCKGEFMKRISLKHCPRCSAPIVPLPRLGELMKSYPSVCPECAARLLYDTTGTIYLDDTDLVHRS